MKRFPLTVQTTYADLLSRLQDDAVYSIDGTPVCHERNGRNYWYARRYVDRKQVETYIGPETPELLERIDKMQTDVDRLKNNQKDRVKLVKMLRQAGLLAADVQTGKILSAIAAAGAFRLRAVLIGSHAFRTYPAILGVDILEALAATEDIDVAQFDTISVAVEDQIDPAFEEVLKTVDVFQPRPTLDHRDDTAAWRSEGGAVVELLTPMIHAESDRHVHLPALQASAQPLKFLDYLIYETVPAAVLYRGGVLVNVPPPAKYAVHKLIVATMRTDTSAKAAKDIAQAAALIRILAEDQPDELEAAYNQAVNNGPKWKAAVKKGARRLPKDAAEQLSGLSLDS